MNDFLGSEAILLVEAIEPKDGVSGPESDVGKREWVLSGNSGLGERVGWLSAMGRAWMGDCAATPYL